MTCEVVVANRMAVALAADSAVTFADIGNDGSRKETYSWGASKIFQLSQLAPVGIMFYDAADMQGVPWELITKTFSAWLGRDTKRTLSDYVAAFASFVEANNLLFPREDRLTLFRSAATGSLLRVLEEVRYACTTEHTGWGGGNDAAAIAAAFRAICDAWAEKPLPRRCSAAQVQAAVEEHSTWLSDACIELIQHDESLLQVVDAIPLKALSEVVIRNIYVDAHNAFKQRYTGIVFTGFGDDEPYPSIREFRCYGLVLDHLVLDDRDCVAVSISQHKHSHIEAFAQKSAVEAFVGGCSQETYQEIDRTYLRHAHDLVQELIRAGASLPDADAILRRSAVAFSGEWYEGILRSNVMPLKAVLAGMSPRELAEFAEALVVLESLKERVTARTRSVGGPTSIAVITKSDGFRWVRRQEDYEPSTHSRFRHRTLQEYHA